jgi:hypothetical protein
MAGMDDRKPDNCAEWDPYRVWQILLHRHPVRVDDVAGSSGHIERELLAEFCEAIADYPDFLQDTLLLIAHAQGVEAAAQSLDAAVREEHAERLAQTAPAARRLESG